MCRDKRRGETSDKIPESSPEPEVEKRIPDDETDGEKSLRTGELFEAKSVFLVSEVGFTVDELASVYCAINRDRETVVIDRQTLELILAGYSQLVRKCERYEKTFAAIACERAGV